MARTRIRARSSTRVFAIALGAAAVLAARPEPARAQADDEAPIHWAYAPYFGTGRYRASGAEQIYALGGKPGRLIRAPSQGGDGERRAGIQFRVPLSVSLHDVDTGDVLANVDLDNVGTISAVPGVELELALSERWRLKPLVHAGWGGALDGDDSAWIYWTGLMSELSFAHGKIEWQLVNGLTGVGYSPRGGASQRVFPLLSGFEFGRPLERHRIGGETVHLHWHVAHTHYLDELEFRGGIGTPSLEIDREWEVGIAFSKGDSKLRFRRLELDRVGIAYRFDAGGNFDGVTLVLKSLFER